VSKLVGGLRRWGFQTRADRRPGHPTSQRSTQVRRGLGEVGHTSPICLRSAGLVRSLLALAPVSPRRSSA